MERDVGPMEVPGLRSPKIVLKGVAEKSHGPIEPRLHFRNVPVLGEEDLFEAAQVLNSRVFLDDHDIVVDEAVLARVSIRIACGQTNQDDRPDPKPTLAYR
jgi:hypothetical protein